MDNSLNKYIELKNDRLCVEIARPGMVYNGSRFDWTGFITKVILDNKHSFCVPESLIPGEGSGGFGLCNEFGIDTPVGYNDAKPGGQFPKIGVGLLTRYDHSEYFFFNKYEVTPFPVRIISDSTSSKFEIPPIECNGYAIKMVKEITLDNNRLSIHYHIENTGTKSIKTEEYCHNFFAINNNKVGSGYLLRFPYDIEPDTKPNIMSVSGHEIRWSDTPKKDFKCCIGGFKNKKQHHWELLFEPERAGVKEYSKFTIAKVAVWGTTHVISPEVFVDIDIPPGKTFDWTRIYEFFSY